MRDSRAHVEASGRCPQGRRRDGCRRDRRRRRVRVQSSASPAPAPPLPRWRPRGPRAEVPAATQQPAADTRRRARPDRRPPDGAHRRRPGRGPGDHRVAPGARGPAGPIDLDHPTRPPCGWPRRPRASQAATQLLAPLRGRGAQRAVAVRRHPLAPGGRDRGRGLLVARRPFPRPARLHGLRAGLGRRCRGQFTVAGEEHGWSSASTTLKRWLGQQPAPGPWPSCRPTRTWIAERPHRAIGRVIGAAARRRVLASSTSARSRVASTGRPVQHRRGRALRHAPQVIGSRDLRQSPGSRMSFEHERERWSGRRDSNPRHSAWEADTLPTELLPPGASAF